jgi:hypothetical protein
MEDLHGDAGRVATGDKGCIGGEMRASLRRSTVRAGGIDASWRRGGARRCGIVVG